MGYRVTAEVFDHSRQKGGKLLILLAIAETSHNEDGVAFGLDQGWPSSKRVSERRKKETIAGKARLDPSTVAKLVKELWSEDDDELEVRQVQNGRERTFVYRPIIGLFRDLDVDVERLERYQQRLDRPFSTPEELALPWALRPGNFAGGRISDDLASGPQRPGTSSCDDLASDRADTPLYARAAVQSNGPNPSLTVGVEEDHFNPDSADAGVGEQAGEGTGEPGDVSTRSLVDAFAGKLGRWPQGRGEWGAWMRAFAPLAAAGVTVDELTAACESYLAFHHKFGRVVDLTPFGLTKHWQVVSQAVAQSVLTWTRWATETAWRLPEDEAEWLLDQAAGRMPSDQHAGVVKLARRIRGERQQPDSELLRWVESDGWMLDDDSWRDQLNARLPRGGASDLRRVATHRRHEMRRELARLRAIGLPPVESHAA